MSNINFSNIPTKVYLLNDYLLRQNSNGFIENARDLNGHTDAKTPVPKGLYDPYIFNINNRCICSMRTQYIDHPVQCPKCRTIVVSDEQYNENYALFNMNVPYINFIKIDALFKELKKIGMNQPFKTRGLQDLWSMYLLESDTPFEINGFQSPSFFDKEGKETYFAFADLPGDSKDDIPTKDQLGHKISIDNMGLFGIQKLSRYYTSEAYQLNKIGDLINRYLVITSPGRRPLHQFKDSMGRLIVTVPEESINYRCIIFFSKQVKKYLEMKTMSITDKATYCWYLNNMINAHFSSNELLQDSKHSLGRTILDTRVAKSLRALITASIDLPMDTIGLPKTLVYKCLQKEIIEEISQELVQKRKENKKKVDLESIDLDAKKHYLEKSDLANRIFYEMIEARQDTDGEWIIPAMCTLTRNPSLHRWNVLAYKIKLVDDITIHLPIATDEG